MKKSLVSANLRALEFHAMAVGISGSVHLEYADLGPNRTEVTYRGPIGARGGYRHWSISNDRGYVYIGISNRTEPSLGWGFHSGGKAPASVQKRFAQFIAALTEDSSDIVKSPLLANVREVLLAELPPDILRHIENELAPYTFARAFKNRLGPIVALLAQASAEVQATDALSKLKAKETRRRRAEFKSLPPGTGFSVAGRPGCVVLKRRQDDKYVEFREPNYSTTVRLTSDLLHSLALATTDAMRTVTCLTGHEKMDVLSHATAARKSCPAFAAGPSQFDVR